MTGHPSRGQHNLLARLIQRAAKRLDRHGARLHDFLTSDLGAPLPLHISLSRPLALDTARKDDYLDEVSLGIKARNTGCFAVVPTALVWHQSPDSNRTFLVLRVASREAREDLIDPPGKKENKNNNKKKKNQELAALLAACNDVARRFDQPALYSSGAGDSTGSGSGCVEDAFHVSIGWTFGLASDDEAAVEALELFGDDEFREMQAWEIEVSGVKAKIGNVVTHVPLSSQQLSKRSLFGI
ncbi:U6 snRNA phosphodiesterase [Escovopsis weberi]|uniref:U6 snRNA phosphodiesterase 1 n=1 Tax=Escovopsis weberi TaxID=150374 RepID=A0A0M8N1X4_ESCWE|nr:U6 snRNA phosphodiesterase [Escovopsis weberi]